MPNSPDSRRSLRSLMNAAFTRSPMMDERARTNANAARVGIIAAGIAAAVLAIAAIRSKVFEPSSHAPDVSPLTACDPGDLDCHDENFNEGPPVSNGEPDGCSLLTIREQLASPLCCPGILLDPTDCPPLEHDAAPRP